MNTMKVEGMKLNLTFACRARGECKRLFVCINPEDLLEHVCPELIAYDYLKQLREKNKE